MGCDVVSATDVLDADKPLPARERSNPYTVEDSRVPVHDLEQVIASVIRLLPAAGDHNSHAASLSHPVLDRAANRVNMISTP